LLNKLKEIFIFISEVAEVYTGKNNFFNAARYGLNGQIKGLDGKSRRVGKIIEEERLNGLMGEDGITNCGNAQNCIEVCPMSIPLTKAIYETNRDITVDALFGWLKK